MKKQHSSKCATLKNKKCDCDGYHTFGELYDHRIILYIILCKTLCLEYDVWCSEKHSDGAIMPGWFVLGINKKKGKQITYHLPVFYWDTVCMFAEVLNKAPKYDGHTSDDVLKRLAAI